MVRQIASSSASTDKLLRIIVALILRGFEKEPQSLRQKIQILSDLGMGPAEIAATLGKTPTHVSKELAGLRKNRKTTRG